MGLFMDKRALELDRLGNSLVGRSAEAERLKNILSGVKTGLLPKLIGVYGPPGSGKTLVVRKVCSEFEKISGGQFRFVYVNLGETKTVFSCANRIVAALGGEWRSDRVVGLDGIMEQFWTRVLSWTDEHRRFMLLCFDEADQLFKDRRSNPSGFIYRLVRSQDRLEGSGVNLSLLTISNTPIWEIWDLDGRVRSSMGVEEIFFQPYTRKDLKQILNGRCKEAFKPGVVSEDVIEACVDYTAEQSRDVRRMVDLLRVCAETAEIQSDRKLEMKHFTEALKRFEMDYHKALFDGLAEMQLNLLHALAWLSEIEGVTVASTSQVYEKYHELLKKTAPSYRRVSGVLKELEVMNLIGGRNVSKGRGGRVGEMWLKVPARTILDYRGVDWRKMKRMRSELKELRKRIGVLKR